jgi:DNA-binding transcriptional regulator YiaG
MKPTNPFNQWYKKSTSGMTRQQRTLFNINLAAKMQKSNAVIGNWIRGTSEPSALEKKAINVILRKKIYTV